MDHTWSCGSRAVSLFRSAAITSTPRSTWSPALQLLLHRPTVPSAHGRWAIVQPATDSAGTPAYYTAKSTTVPTVNTWVHLTGVFDASRGVLQLYVNGRLEATTVAIPAMWHANGTVHIGRADTGDWVRGTIDDVPIFAGALPAAEVAKLYQP
jgi:hypothetical protein